MTPEEQLRALANASLANAGLSQAQAARLLGLSNKHINQMLLGRSHLTLDWADQILELCGMQLVLSVRPTSQETP